jgi:pimeloyl-ACP methyl ester carboxylesterase
MWNYQLPDLMAARLRCITYGRRGHGRSDRPGAGYDIDTLADDLGAVIDQLDLTDITLIGHSMGAAEVPRYITRHGPERIARLILSGTVTPMLLQSDDNPDEIRASVAAQMRAPMARDIGDWMEMNGRYEYFLGKHRVSRQLLDWTLNTIAAVLVPILAQTVFVIGISFRLLDDQRCDRRVNRTKDPRCRLGAVGTAYISFALTEPGLFGYVFSIWRRRRSRWPRPPAAPAR